MLDASGKVIAEGEVGIDQRRFLPVGGETRIELEKAGTEVHVIGIHDAPTAIKPIEFLDVRLPL